MARIEHTVTINASVDAVYSASQDYAVRYEWDPFPENIEFLGDEQTLQKGSRVRVTARNGLTMDVAFVQLSPPHTAVIKMLRGPLVLASFAGSWLFKPTPDGATKARFVYTLHTRKWLFPPVADRIAGRYFRAVVEQRLEALKTYCER